MNYKGYIWLLVLLLALTGCHDETQEVAQLRLSICLPEVEQAAGRRVMGDPGVTEMFELPKYAYIFVMKDNGDGTWSVWRREERTLAAEDWIRTRYYGLNNTREDSIFKYDKDIQFLLKGETLNGRVYAVCSNMKLNFNTAFNSVSNLTQLLNWTFDSSPDSIQEDLQNIYSTPYNYIRERDGQYYCSFQCTQAAVYSIDLIMYHVAAKVDINWYVPTDKRYDKVTPANGIRLTYMDACNLFNGDAFCFKPMENVVGVEPLASGATKHIIGSGDEGMWWEGRSYFYTIPYTTTESGKENYYPLQMLMKTNGSAGEGYKPTIYMEIDKSSPFVPWLRATFNVSKQLTDGGSETQVVNLTPTP